VVGSFFQGRRLAEADQIARREADQIATGRDATLKRQPILDQQADADRALALGDKQVAREDAAARSKRDARLRGLMTVKAGMTDGMDVGDALQTLGPGGLRAFGDDFGDMAGFANAVRQNPKVLDAQIAGLSGNARARGVKAEEYVTGPDGKEGLHVLYDDGTDAFLPGFKKQFSPTDGPSAAQGAGLPGTEYRPGQGYFDGDGNKLTADQVRQLAFDFKASQAAGTAAGKEGASEVPWTPVQAINARTTFDTLSLKNENLNSAIDTALSNVSWASAGLVGQLKGVAGEPANLAAMLQSVGAQIGLDELTKLKQAGVTLGQVTEAEHKLLQSMIADLSQITDPNVLRAALQKVKQQSNRAWRITRDNLTGIAQAKGGMGQTGGDAPAEPSSPKKSSKYYD